MRQEMGGVPDSVREYGDGDFNLYFRTEYLDKIDWLVVRVPFRHRKQLQLVSKTFRDLDEGPLISDLRSFTVPKLLERHGLPEGLELVAVKDGERWAGMAPEPELEDPDPLVVSEPEPENPVEVGPRVTPGMPESA